MALRVSGEVINIERKEGVKTRADGSGYPWAFDVVRVLVKRKAVVEVTLFTDEGQVPPEVGDTVDYEVTVREGRFGISYQAVGAW